MPKGLNLFQQHLRVGLIGRYWLRGLTVYRTYLRTYPSLRLSHSICYSLPSWAQSPDICQYLCVWLALTISWTPHLNTRKHQYIYNEPRIYPASVIAHTARCLLTTMLRANDRAALENTVTVSCMHSNEVRIPMSYKNIWILFTVHTHGPNV